MSRRPPTDYFNTRQPRRECSAYVNGWWNIGGFLFHCNEVEIGVGVGVNNVHWINLPIRPSLIALLLVCTSMTQVIRIFAIGYLSHLSCKDGLWDLISASYLIKYGHTSRLCDLRIVGIPEVIF